MPSGVPWTVLALSLAVLVTAILALPLSSRGGRFRALPGWVGFWAFFAALLAALPRVHLGIALLLLGLAMFGALREYFFLAPVRPQDRWAILVAYLTIPGALYPIHLTSYGLFLATVLLSLFLVLPTLLSAGTPRPGLFDSMGRVLLGLLVYVFCTAHLGWIARQPEGRLELFGVLVLASELPQRLAGRIRSDERIVRPLAGIVTACALAASLGSWMGTALGIQIRHGMVAGLLVALSVTAGRIVTEAVSQDLKLDPATSRVGRGALLDRTMPAVYAAPLFFHYLYHALRPE